MRQGVAIGTLLLVVLLAISPGARAEEASDRRESTNEAVHYLIDTVAHSHLTFIRNGEEHSCTEAAAHIQRKYDHFKSKIQSPQDFIHLCASKSILSGQPYLVATDRGKVPVEEWLKGILTEHQRNLHHS